MRLLYLTDNTSDHNRRFLAGFVRYGLEVFYLDISNGMVDSDWLPDGAQSVHLAQSLSADVTTNQIEKAVPYFGTLINRIRPDVIHAGPVPNCGYLATLSGFHPLVLMSWGSDLLGYDSDTLERKHRIETALRATDGFFCDCDAVKQIAKQVGSLPDSQIVQFPWGIERGLFSPHGASLREELGFSPKDFVLIHTRSWGPIYDVNTLLQAFRIAHDEDPRLHMIMLGGGSESHQVESFIAKHKLQTCIVTPGMIPREKLPAWFRTADAYASCALSDGTSVSLLEAMATGLPVVVTDIPSNREWVQEGHNGFLARKGDPKNFAQEFLRCVALSTSDRRRILLNNQVLVAEHADWTANFPQLPRLYERLCAERLVKA